MTSIEWLEGQFKIYLPSIHQKGLENAFEKAKEIHKAEQENLYTEEDMMEYAVWLCIESNSASGRNRTSKDLLSEWVKQFKKD